MISRSNKHSMNNNPGGDSITAEVTNLSPIATEKELHDFFALCGKIDHIEILRASEVASTAYVTFRSSRALEIAVLLNGATIVDQPVCIARWGHYEKEEEDDDYWNQFPWKPEEEAIDSSFENTQGGCQNDGYVSTAEEVMGVVKTMLSKGYVLGQDALERARVFDDDELHQLSAKVGNVRSCVLKGAVWVSDALSEAAEVAVDLGSQGIINNQ